VSACETVEVAILIATLGRRGISVAVVGDCVVFAGDVHAPVHRRAEGVFLETAMATLDGRTGAVAAAIARGPAFGARIAEERRAASRAIRRGRKLRTSHAKKIQVSVPTVAASSSTSQKSGGSYSAARPLPSVPTFPLDGETA
jgi:hypothetical protein